VYFGVGKHLVVVKDIIGCLVAQFAPFSDLIWMETLTPNIQECKQFSTGVHAKYPNMMLSYNLSPSFNWEAYLSENEISAFQHDIAQMGFVWHFITLAGFHVNSLHTDQLAKGLKEKGVIHYVRTVQHAEAQFQVETLTHQKWSGAEFLDETVAVVTGGSAAASLGKGATESQFLEHATLQAKL